jgi:hypothetical protein
MTAIIDGRCAPTLTIGRLGRGNGALDSCGVFASNEGKRALWSQ